MKDLWALLPTAALAGVWSSPGSYRCSHPGSPALLFMCSTRIHDPTPSVSPALGWALGTWGSALVSAPRGTPRSVGLKPTQLFPRSTGPESSEAWPNSAVKVRAGYGGTANLSHLHRQRDVC